MAEVTCPICESENSIICTKIPTSRDSEGFNCQLCGTFEISRTALRNHFRGYETQFTLMQKAALSHHIRLNSQVTPVVIMSDWLDHFKKSAQLPSPHQQSMNLIRLIGEHFLETGDNFYLDTVADISVVGSINAGFLNQLAQELCELRLIKAFPLQSIKKHRGRSGLTATTYGLTLSGWEKFEQEKQGHFAAKSGFMAMKFGDEKLEKIISETIKPDVKRHIGHDVLDVRNVARAGVIDNIMRQQIRDSAFVLVDLTHDNSGAYWEAGYAEGLGKPVIYICEKKKFDETKTHFDTNHCTTVLWDEAELEKFSAELIATLRRSLNLFDQPREANS